MTATTATTSSIQTKQTRSVQGDVGQLSAISETCEDGNTGFEDGNTGTICQDALRERAYLLWEKSGHPIGDGVDFWIAAEKELISESK